MFSRMNSFLKLTSHFRIQFRLASTQCLQYSVNGDPMKVVELKSIPQKSLGSNDVRIKMLAAPINPADINVIQGKP